MRGTRGIVLVTRGAFMVSRSVGQSSRGSHCRVLHKVGVMFHVNQGLASHTPPIFACHNKHFSSGAYKRGFCSAIASDNECTGYANRDISNPATATNHGFHRERAKLYMMTVHIQRT